MSYRCSLPAWHSLRSYPGLVPTEVPFPPGRVTPRGKELLVIQTQPRLETVIENYDVMLDEMRAVISIAVPTGTWASALNAQVERLDETVGSERLCVGRSALWNYTTETTQAERDYLIEKLSRLGSKYGFSALRALHDRTGGFQAAASDEFGAQLEFGGSRFLTISYTTGIHLARASSIVPAHSTVEGL